MCAVRLCCGYGIAYSYKYIKTYLGGKNDVWDDEEVSNYMKMFEVF